MKSFFFLFIFSICSFYNVQAQNKYVITDRVVVKDYVQFQNDTIWGVVKDTSLSANNNNTTPTTKAVKAYVDNHLSSAGGVYTASNGVGLVVKNIEWGGNLTHFTTISGASNYGIGFNNLTNFYINTGTSLTRRSSFYLSNTSAIPTYVKRRSVTGSKISELLFSDNYLRLQYSDTINGNKAGLEFGINGSNYYTYLRCNNSPVGTLEKRLYMDNTGFYLKNLETSTNTETNVVVIDTTNANSGVIGSYRLAHRPISSLITPQVLSISGTTVALSNNGGSVLLPEASISSSGIITTGNQSLVGIKTFSAVSNTGPSTSGSTLEGNFRIKNNYSTSGNIGALDFGFDTGGNKSTAWLQSRNAQNYATNNYFLLQPNGGNIGVGVSGIPSNTLHIKSAIPNESGLRIEGLTNSSPVGTSTAYVAVDAVGNLVRGATPTATVNTQYAIQGNGSVANPIQLVGDGPSLQGPAYGWNAITGGRGFFNPFDRGVTSYLSNFTNPGSSLGFLGNGEIALADGAAIFAHPVRPTNGGHTTTIRIKSPQNHGRSGKILLWKELSTGVTDVTIDAINSLNQPITLIGPSIFQIGTGSNNGCLIEFECYSVSFNAGSTQKEYVIVTVTSF
ncbi:MAG: hypothetical protein RLZZ292_646 [Bacteroidota bacterium]|jgi:hypothetical protein